MFSLTYLTNTCGVNRTVALMAVVVASGVMACFIPMWGAMADRIGKGRIFGTAALLLGITSFPVFWVLHNYATTNLFFVYLAIIIPFGIVYAAAYASMASLCSDSFDASVRYSSISFVYQFSGIFASGLPPMAHSPGTCAAICLWPVLSAPFPPYGWAPSASAATRTLRLSAVRKSPLKPP